VLEEGNRFSFFQVVRLLQMFHPGMARVGHRGPPVEEAIRFRPVLDLCFPASDIEDVTSIRTDEGEPRYEVTTTFLGLYGSATPMASWFTENILDDTEGSALVRGFLDLFHHRLISLFYRAWEKYTLPPPESRGGGDLNAKRLLALVGIDEEIESKDSTDMKTWRLLAVAGLAALQPRSAASLEGILKNIFPRLQVRVEEFVGRWIEVPRAERNRLAKSNCFLGRNTTLGERVLSYVNTFRIHVGPVEDMKFLSQGPQGDMLQRLRAVVDLFNQDCLDYEIEVNVNPGGMPDPLLGSELPRLGWSTWIGRKPKKPKIVRFLVKGWLHG
jgi:type VI secretion system protein ImpH